MCIPTLARASSDRASNTTNSVDLSGGRAKLATTCAPIVNRVQLPLATLTTERLWQVRERSFVSRHFLQFCIGSGHDNCRDRILHLRQTLARVPEHQLW